MPASARNSVDLPEPERPVITTEWPGSKTRSAFSSSFMPFGSLMLTSRIRTDRPWIGQRQSRAEAARAAIDRTVESGQSLDDRMPLCQVGIPR